MPETTSRYFLRRAEAHMKLAHRAESPSIADIHRSLAREYQDRALEQGVSPESDVVFRSAP